MDGFKSLTHEIRSCCQLTKSQGPRYQSKNAKGSGASAKRFSKIRSLGLRAAKERLRKAGYVKWWPKLQKMHLEMMTVMLFFRSTPCRNWTIRNTHALEKEDPCNLAYPCINLLTITLRSASWRNVHVKSFLLHLQTLRKATHCSEQWLQKLPRAWTVTFGSPGFQGNGGTSQKLHRQWTWRRDTVKRFPCCDSWSCGLFSDLVVTS